MPLRKRQVRPSAGPAAAGAGLGFGLAGIALSRMLRPQQRIDLAAVELAFIAGSYPGMALNADDRRGRTVELAIGAAFMGCAFVGLVSRSRRLLAGGLVAHGAWDVAHHVGEPGSAAPEWYPLFCGLADVLLALPLRNARSQPSREEPRP